MVQAATSLVLGGDILWQALCAEWAKNCLNAEEAKKIIQPIDDALIGAPIGNTTSPVSLDLTSPSASGNMMLFDM